MGKRGRAPKIAAVPRSFWKILPDLTREEAETTLGQPIPERVWAQVLEAYFPFTHCHALMEAPRANRKRDDPKSYVTMRNRVRKLIEQRLPLSNLGLERGELIRFLMAFADNAEMWALSTPEGVKRMTADQDAFFDSFDYRVFERRDSKSVERALAILDAAEPHEIHSHGIGDAKVALVRQISAILKKAGLPTNLSTGFDLEMLRDEELGLGAMTEDLTPFEQFISALKIHVTDKPSNLSAWLREALKA